MSCLKPRRLLYTGLVICLLQFASDAQTRPAAPEEHAHFAHGQLVERQLSGGDAHSLRFTLPQRQYLSISIEQRGIDIAATLYGPGGERLAEGHSFFTTLLYEPLVLEAVSAEAGPHRLEIRARKKSAAAGSYELKIETLRDAVASDRQRLAAQSLLARGNFIRADETRPFTWPEVLEKYEAALDVFRASADREGEAQALGHIGWVHMANGENRRAVESSTQAVALFRQTGDRRGEARSLRVIGWVHALSGEKQQALALFNQSLALYRQAGDRRGEAVVLQTIGRLHSQSLECEQAIEYSRQALALFRSLGDRRGEANTLKFIGLYHELMSERTEALAHYERAVEMTRAIGEKMVEAEVLSSVARIYNELGEKRKAINYFKQIGSFDDIGNIYRELGEDETAIQYYLEELKRVRAAKFARGQIDWHHDEAKVMVAIGRAHLALGERQKAHHLFRQALGQHLRELPRLKETGGAWEVKSLHRMAEIHALLGESQSALERYQQALALYRAGNGRQRESHVLTEMATLYDALGQRERALEHHRESLRIRRDVKDLHGAAEAHYQIARIERDRGQPEAARREIEEALLLVESLRARIAGETLRSSYFGTVQKYYEFYVDLLMRLHTERPAEGFAAAALHAHERSRARTMLEALIESRVDITQGVDPALLRRERQLRLQLNASAEKQMRLLSGQHQPEQAAQAAREVDALTTEYEQVEARIRASSPRYAELTRPVPLTLKEIQSEVLDSDTLLLVYALGAARSYLWVVGHDSLTAIELASRAEIERDARRVSVLLGDHRSPVAGIAGASDKRYAEAALSLSRMLLPPDAVAALLGNRRLVFIADGALQRLPFGALPSPVETGKQRAALEETVRETHAGRGRRRAAAARTVVPETEPLRPLVLDHEVVNLPSATTLSLLRRELRARPRASKSVAVLADPVFNTDDERVERRRKVSYEGGDMSRLAAAVAGGPPLSEKGQNGVGAERPDRQLSIRRLPFTRREAEAILAASSRGDEMKAVDFGATREAVAGEEIRQYRIVHFATHGLLNSEQPQSSGIVLSLVDRQGQAIDGFLSLAEIYKLDLGAELVVLSACESGLGKDVRGEGLIGLVRGFMFAGSPRVVASLWKVDDRATAELMRRFYEGMFQKSLRPSAALRAAKIEMWRQKRWQSPFYWAAFELQGEWR